MKDRKIYIEPYIQSVTTSKTAPKTLTNTRKCINYALEFFASQESDNLGANFYSGFREYLKAENKLADSTIDKVITNVRNFFEFCADKERSLSIEPASDTEETSKSDVLDVEQQKSPDIEQEHEQEQLPAEPDENSSQPAEIEQNFNQSDNESTVAVVEAPESEIIQQDNQAPAMSTPKKPGRKRKDTENGEMRSEKVTLYLTKTTYTDVKKLAILCDMSINDYISLVIKRETERLKDDINVVEQIRNRVSPLN